jgi:hypothetical protein
MAKTLYFCRPDAATFKHNKHHMAKSVIRHVSPQTTKFALCAINSLFSFINRYYASIIANYNVLVSNYQALNTEVNTLTEGNIICAMTTEVKQQAYKQKFQI